MISDLIYAYVTCPVCNQETLPLQAWFSPDDCGEDGHCEGFDLCELRCPQCGIIEGDTDEIVATCEEIENSLWEGTAYEIGSIRSYFPRKKAEKKYCTGCVHYEEEKGSPKWGWCRHPQNSDICESFVFLLFVACDRYEPIPEEIHHGPSE